MKCYEHALELNPKNISAWNNKGISLRSIGRYDEAIRSFDKAIEIDNNYEWGWHNKGFTLSEMGRLEDALKCYNHALEINPNYQAAIKHQKRILRILALKEKEESMNKTKKKSLKDDKNRE